MPASESTWRDQNRLHQVFAITCGLLLLATIWMFVADNSREWKPIQTKANNIEDRMTAWRQIQFQTDESLKAHDALEQALSSAQSEPIDAEALQSFKDAVVAADPKADRAMTAIDRMVDAINTAAREALSLREAAQKKAGDLESYLKNAEKLAESAEKAKKEVATSKDRGAAERAYNEAKKTAETARNELLTQRNNVKREEEAASRAETRVAGMRQDLFDQFDARVKRAKFEEDTFLSERKFKSADRDKEVAAQGILVRDSRGRNERERAAESQAQAASQQVIDKLTSDIGELTLKYQAATEFRKSLQQSVQKMRDKEETARKAVEKNRDDLTQLANSTVERRSTFFVWYGYIPIPGKRWLELPILDAFNSPRKIDNLWSDGLTIDYNFKDVRRFDRCTTCHKALEKSLPGQADKPAYAAESFIDLTLAAAPAEDASAIRFVNTSSGIGADLERRTGLRLAAEGLINSTDVIVTYVRPNSTGAKASPSLEGSAKQAQDAEALRLAIFKPDVSPELGIGDRKGVMPGLQVGDVIARINGNPIDDANKAATWLLEAAGRGEALRLTVRRGMPHPFATHPRLELFVGSMSPHKSTVFACTICHDGQGSATMFKWASHTPNSTEQAHEWGRTHGWFDNEHWIYPMYAKRFSESTCLKCHHDVVDLEPSERFPEAPAPKVVRGYNLIRKYGCYGCHEVNGYDGPTKRVGPDLRLEPNFFAAAQQIKADPGYAKLNDTEKNWIDELIRNPDRDGVRHRLSEALATNEKSGQPSLSSDTYKNVVPVLKDVESPGTLRKPGPSLRFAAAKMDPEFLFDWIKNPKEFRPSTRMPRFFQLWDHLQGSGREIAEKLEPVEVLGIATYLQERSQPFDFLAPPEGIAESSAEEKAARGKVLFQRCIACHSHKDFADAEQFRGKEEIVQGPDLSAVGEKFSPDRNPNGPKWLYSWIKEPTRYHPRTVMPNNFLNPVKAADGSLSDPVADIVEYLLQSSKSGWKPGTGTLVKPEQVNAKDLDRLVLEHLKDAFFEKKAAQHLEHGIPAAMRDDLKGAETEMVVSNEDAANPSFKIGTKQKLLYVGRKTIAKYGCYGCHDIAGFEDAKPIGTGLADWGRKDPSRLAFEHITHYLHQHGGGHGSGHGGAANSDAAHTAEHGDAEHGDAGHGDAGQQEMDPFFKEQIESGNRIGFIYQKLREPRSYDYHKTENKKYNDRLRMPQFPFDAEEREAVIAFVLGLVADPPAERFVYRPDERATAIIEGRKALEKYNCGGCHILRPEQWSISFDDKSFPEQPDAKIYPFVKTHLAPEILAASQKADRRGLFKGTLHGLPGVGDDGKPVIYDSEGDPVEEGTSYDPSTLQYPIDLWRATPLAGKVYEMGLLPLNVRASLVDGKLPATGGFLTRYLLPKVVAAEKQVNPAAKGAEAWGWLPPPLIGQGQKVQSEWFHNFLLDPQPIRPAVVLRMPKFNMSPAEATAIVNYFAAIDNADYPYEFSDRKRPEHVAAKDTAYRSGSDAPAGSRLDDAMKIVVDNNYCVKCHRIGDFEPNGADRAKAPNLAEVHRRLRSDYVRKWIANPKSILPYTSMPVNVPFDPESPTLGGVNQALYHGTSVDQVDALVDLLMNFDDFSKSRTKISAMVKPAPAGAAPADGAPANGTSAGDGKGESENKGTTDAGDSKGDTKAAAGG